MSADRIVVMIVVKCGASNDTCLISIFICLVWWRRKANYSMKTVDTSHHYTIDSLNKWLSHQSESIIMRCVENICRSFASKLDFILLNTPHRFYGTRNATYHITNKTDNIGRKLIDGFDSFDWPLARSVRSSREKFREHSRTYSRLTFLVWFVQKSTDIVTK